MTRRISIIFLLICLLGMVGLVEAQDNQPVITPDNVAQLAPLMQLGYGPLYGHALSPDGTRIAALVESGVAIYDTTDLATPLMFLAGELFITPSAVAYSPDGNLIAAGNYVGEVRVWDAISGEQLAILENPRYQTEELVFHPSEPVLAVGMDFEGTVHLWNLETFQELGVLKISDNVSVVALEYSADGSRLRAIDGAGRYVIWQNGQEIRRTERIGAVVEDADFDPENDDLIAYVVTGLANIVLREGNETFEKQFADENIRAVVTTFNPDMSRIVEGWSNKRAYIRDVESGETLHILEHDGFINEARFTPDGTRVWVSTGDDNALSVWDVETGRLIERTVISASSMLTLGFSPDSTLIAGAGVGYDQIMIWDTRTGELVHQFASGRTNNSLAFSADGQYLAAGGQGDYSVQVWDVQTGALVYTFVQHTSVINSLLFDPNSTLLAVGSSDETITAWNMQSGKRAYTITGFGSVIYSVAFSTDGETLMASSGDKQIRFFQAADGAETSAFTPEIDVPLTIMVSADTSGIIIGSDSDARTYELNTSVIMPNIPAVVGSSGRRAVFDPATSMFAAAVNTQGKIVFIDLIRNRGANLKELFVSGRSPYAIAFSPNGRLFASGGRDGLITLWGIPTGE